MTPCITVLVLRRANPLLHALYWYGCQSRLIDYSHRCILCVLLIRPQTLDIICYSSLRNAMYYSKIHLEGVFSRSRSLKCWIAVKQKRDFAFLRTHLITIVSVYANPVLFIDFFHMLCYDLSYAAGVSHVSTHKPGNTNRCQLLRVKEKKKINHTLVHVDVRVRWGIADWHIIIHYMI